MRMKTASSKQRAAGLFSHLDDAIDAVLIVNSRMPFLDHNFRYMTDIMGGVFELSFALATRGGVTVVTSDLEKEIASNSDNKLITFKTSKEMESKFERMMKGKKVVGINMAGITYSSVKYLRKKLKGVKLKDVSKQLDELRMIKSDYEIERIAKAGRIASRVAEEIPDMMEIGMTEKRAAAEIDYLMREYGADTIGFDTIAAFGPASSLPHYQPGDRKLKRGNVALFDFGAMYGNYVSDITRTYFTKPLDKRLAGMYGVVKEAQAAGIQAIRPKARAKKVDKAARDVIERAGYGRLFIHSLGHGLGISVHDPGSLSPRSKEILRENMVMTVEPGLYLPGRGGVRIEDDVLVTEDGRRVLTTASRELAFI